MTRWATPALAAAGHARRGWVLVPLAPGTSTKPVRRWRNLTSTPPGSVAATWPGPWHNPGIITGPSGLVVVDLDTPEHGSTMPPEWSVIGAGCGSDVLAVLAVRRREQIPPTYTVRTPRAGTHLYFTAPAGRVIRNSTDLIGPMIDVRATGGLIAGAGSVRDDGVYELADERSPVPLPGWLADLATRRPRHAAHDVSADVSAAPGTGYAAAALRREIAILLCAQRGHRNDELNRSAFALGTLVGAGFLDEADVTAALMQAAEVIGLAADDGPAACERTITSGLVAGIARPRVRTWRAAS